MYVSPISTRLVRGRSTPAIRAIYPCLCLCFWLLQITRTTPSRRTILHLTQIFLTDALTFMVATFSTRLRRALPRRAPSHDPSSSHVARAQRHQHAIAHDQPDEIAPGSSAGVR